LHSQSGALHRRVDFFPRPVLLEYVVDLSRRRYLPLTGRTPAPDEDATCSRSGRDRRTIWARKALSEVMRREAFGEGELSNPVTVLAIVARTVGRGDLHGQLSLAEFGCTRAKDAIVTT
jgi:hypothetical protein